MMRTLTCAVAALMIAGAPCMSNASHLGAQTLSQLPADSRILLFLSDSLQSPPGRFSFQTTVQSVRGRLVRTTADSVTIKMAGASEFSIARTAIRGARVSHGVSRTGNALRFGLSLAFTGALVAIHHSDGQQYHRGQDMLVGGAVGFGVGAAFGASFPIERWHRIRK